MMPNAEARDGIAEAAAVSDRHLVAPGGGCRRQDWACARRWNFVEKRRVVRGEGPLRLPTLGCRMHQPAIGAIERGKPEWESPSPLVRFVLAKRT